jgi:uncharacterized protein YrzB (UPF0473 family)
MNATKSMTYGEYVKKQKEEVRKQLDLFAQKLQPIADGLKTYGFSSKKFKDNELYYHLLARFTGKKQITKDFVVCFDLQISAENSNQIVSYCFANGSESRGKRKTFSISGLEDIKSVDIVHLVSQDLKEIMFEKLKETTEVIKEKEELLANLTKEIDKI